MAIDRGQYSLFAFLSPPAIREILARPESSLQETIGQQISHLREKIESQTLLVEPLEAIHRRLELAERVSVDQLTRLMEIMTLFDKYYTPEQMEYLKKRGEEKIRHDGPSLHGVSDTW